MPSPQRVGRSGSGRPRRRAPSIQTPADRTAAATTWIGISAELKVDGARLVTQRSCATGCRTTQNVSTTPAVTAVATAIQVTVTDRTDTAIGYGVPAAPHPFSGLRLDRWVMARPGRVGPDDE